MISYLVSATAVGLEASEFSSNQHEDKDDVSWVDEGGVLPALKQQRPIDRPQPSYGNLGVELTQATYTAERRLCAETTSTAPTKQKFTETSAHIHRDNINVNRVKGPV